MADHDFDDTKPAPPRRGSRPFAGPAPAPRVPLLKPPVVPMRATRPPFASISPDRSRVAPLRIAPVLSPAIREEHGSVQPATGVLVAAHSVDPALLQGGGEVIDAAAFDSTPEAPQAGAHALRADGFDAWAFEHERGDMVADPVADSPVPLNEGVHTGPPGIGVMPTPVMADDVAGELAVTPDGTPCVDAVSEAGVEVGEVRARPEAFEGPAWLRDDEPPAEEPVPTGVATPDPVRVLAASTLERLAERVRGGEIDVSSVAPDSTEAAVLASLLVALLGGSARR